MHYTADFCMHHYARFLQIGSQLLLTLEPGPTTDTSKLTQLKLSLQEKLEMLRQLDSEILDG